VRTELTAEGAAADYDDATRLKIAEAFAAEVDGVDADDVAVRVDDVAGSVKLIVDVAVPDAAAVAATLAPKFADADAASTFLADANVPVESVDAAPVHHVEPEGDAGDGGDGGGGNGAAAPPAAPPPAAPAEGIEALYAQAVEVLTFGGFIGACVGAFVVLCVLPCCCCLVCWCRKSKKKKKDAFTKVDSNGMRVGAPQNVRHEGHVGLSPDGQMEVAMTSEMEASKTGRKMMGALGGGGAPEPDYHAHARGRANSDIHLSFGAHGVAPPRHDTNRRSEGGFGDWEEFTTDDGTGRKYYYNATTDATSWELPISARVVTPAPGAYESSYGGGGGGGYGNYVTSGYGNSYAPAADYGSYNAYGNYPQSASV